MSKAGQDHAAISTKVELLQRLRQRMPQAQMDFSPGGLLAQTVRKDIRCENERRIARLRASLHSAHDALEVQHSFARLGGFAAAQFTKER